MTFTVVLVGWIFSLCLHEFAHAAVAYVGGDTSVRQKGYLTFNPLRYMDPTLSIIMPLLFLVLGGIGLPGGAVYIDESRLRSKYWSCAVSLAGPAANLVLIVVLVRALAVDPIAKSTVAPAMAFLALLQVTAVVLNVLPLPPLDGYRALAPFLGQHLRTKLDSWGYVGLWILVLVLSFVPIASGIFWSATFGLAAAMGIPLPLAARGAQDFRLF